MLWQPSSVFVYTEQREVCSTVSPDKSWMTNCTDDVQLWVFGDECGIKPTDTMLHQGAPPDVSTVCLVLATHTSTHVGLTLDSPAGSVNEHRLCPAGFVLRTEQDVSATSQSHQTCALYTVCSKLSYEYQTFKNKYWQSCSTSRPLHVWIAMESYLCTRCNIPGLNLVMSSLPNLSQRI